MAPKKAPASAATTSTAASDPSIVPETPKRAAATRKQKSAPVPEPEPQAPEQPVQAAAGSEAPAVAAEPVAPAATSNDPPSEEQELAATSPEVAAGDASTDAAVAVAPKERKRAAKQGCVSLELAKRVLVSVQEQQQEAIALLSSKKAAAAAAPREPNAQDIKRIIETFFKLVVDDVKEGKPVTLVNHLTFKRVKRDARDHRIPGKPQETKHKPEHYTIVVDVKPALKKEIEAVPIVPVAAADVADVADVAVADATTTDVEA